MATSSGCPLGFSPSTAVVGGKVSRHPKIPPSIKMFIAPALMMGLSRMGINYKDPMVVLSVRILFGISQVLVLLVSLYIAWLIKKEGDSHTIVKIPKGKKKGKEMEYDEKTYQEYDTEQIKKHLQTFAIGVAVTLALHIYGNVLPALILQIVMQPIALWEHGLFGAFILRDPYTTRPFSDPVASLFPKEPTAETSSEVSPSIQSNDSTEAPKEVLEKMEEKMEEKEKKNEDVILADTKEEEGTLRRRQVTEVTSKES